jgi:hypothetical protein
MSYGYVYSLEYRFAQLSVYNAIRDLWLQSMALGQYPTFSYVDAFVEANAVLVAVELGPWEGAGIPGEYSRGHFSLVAAEVNPR